MHLLLSPFLPPLVDALAVRLAVPLPSPFDVEHVVVPARPMADWLAVSLSERLGIWCNHAVYTPDRLLERLGGAAAQGADAWRILDVLSQGGPGGALAVPQRYLEGDAHGLRGVQLAFRLAALFGRYARQRPDLLRAWRRDDAAGAPPWQAELWRRAHHDLPEPVSAVDAFVASLPAAGLPHRLTVFGLSHLDALDAELILAVDRYVDVTVFAVEGDPLVDLLTGAQVERLPAPRRVSSALGRLQQGLPVEGADDTISVHSCHGRLREVEVLRDRLLMLFDRDRTLQPEDVLVLAPDIDDYAPFIESVFGTEADLHKAPEARARFPVCFADRAPTVDLPGLAAFRSLLRLSGSRRTLSGVTELLDFAPVRERFGLSEADGATCREWLELAAVRWGEDPENRVAFGNPALREHTWRWGLDRLLLGYAMEGGGRRLYDGLLPVDGIEGPAAEPLGALCTLCDALFEQLGILERLRPLDEWPAALIAAFDALVSDRGEWVRARHVLLGLLTGLRGRRQVGIVAVQTWLDSQLEVVKPQSRFFAGGITCASLRLGRAVPARVVAMLGLDHDRFPRDPVPLAFDLLADAPQVTAPREEDRVAFRAALGAASDHLHLSFLGTGSRDNQERPPSVLVAELLDLLAPAARKQALIHHPLQPFVSRAFQEPRQPSFARSWHAGALALRARSPAVAPWFSGLLPAPGDDGQVDLGLLVRFYKNPVAALLSRRLLLRIEGEVEPIPDHEPLDLSYLETWTVGEALLAGLLDGVPVADLEPAVRAMGILPLGTPGKVALEEIRTTAEGIAAVARGCPVGDRLPALRLDLPVGQRRLTGLLDGQHSHGNLFASYSKLDPKRLLPAWIRHLAACLARPAEVSTWAVGRGPANAAASHCWSPTERPAEPLGRLLALADQGMRAPLAFMPNSSLAYAGTWLGLRLDQGESDPRARVAARLAALDKWQGKRIHGGASIPGDGEDPAVARVFDAGVIDTEAFHHTALLVFAPMLGYAIPAELER
ncbi:exodeoxyribonuclease V subunit gamma [Myxococcota bacterium]|nr:exodeoxyribonuclease V subunit gamma [Myxococcota bacterium]